MTRATAPLGVVLAGVPKSGTTSLFHALSEHPQIQVPVYKETYYFNDSITVPWTEGRSFREHGWSGFEQFFHGQQHGRLRLEASGITLYQETALNLFSSMTPPPHIIVSLRCPAEQIRSNFYFHLSYDRIAPGTRFGAYANALIEGDHAALAEMVPGPVLRSQLEPSMQWNRYVEWLDLWRERFPIDGMTVTTLKEVSENTAEVLQRICRHVNIDPDFYEDYRAPHLNATSAGHVRPPGLLSRGGRLIPAGPTRDLLADWYRSRRSGPRLGPPTSSDEAVLDSLGREFRKYNDALAERYGIDTSSWRASQ